MCDISHRSNKFTDEEETDGNLLNLVRKHYMKEPSIQSHVR